MQQAIWNRVGPVAGILSFGLTFIGASIHGFPDVRPTDGQLAKWLASVDLNTFAVGMYIEDLSGIVSIVFAAWLFGYLRQGRAGAALPALVMLCTSVAGVVATFPINAFTLGMLEQARHGLDIRSAQTLVSITQAWFEASGPLGGLAFLGAGVAIVRGRVMSRWVGWAAIFIGLAAFVPGAFLPIWIGVLGLLWDLAVAVYFTIRPVREERLDSALSQASVAAALPAAS